MSTIRTRKYTIDVERSAVIEFMRFVLMLTLIFGMAVLSYQIGGNREVGYGNRRVMCESLRLSPTFQSDAQAQKVYKEDCS